MTGGSVGRVPLLVPILAGAAFGAASVGIPLGDNDVFWHLATARESLAHGLVRVDVFSWTIAGQPVATDQWLGQLSWYAAYLAGGWSGILALRALAVAAVAATVLWTALRERPQAPLVAVLAALPALALSRIVSVERPELLGLLCFALLVPLLRSAHRGNVRAQAAVPVLILIWAQLHGSFALGVGLVILVAATGVLRDGPARRRGHLRMAAAAVLVTLLTPAGIGVWVAPGAHLLHPPRSIQEWAVPDVTSLPGLVFAGVIVLTFATAALAPTRDRGFAVLLLPVLLLSLTAVRQTPFFAIAAAPFLARHGPEALSTLRWSWPTRRPEAARATPGPRADVAALLAGLLLLGAAVGVGPRSPDLARYPTAALPFLTPGPGLLNDYDWGGYLIWSAPGTPVFIDGRLVPYVPAVLDDYVLVVGAGAGWRDRVTQRGIRQLLVRADAPVAVRARELGWPVRVLNDTAVLISVP